MTQPNVQKLTNIILNKTNEHTWTSDSSTVTSNIYSYEFGKRFYPKLLTLKEFCLFSLGFFYWLFVSIKCKKHWNYIDMDIKNNSAKNNVIAYFLLPYYCLNANHFFIL